MGWSKPPTGFGKVVEREQNKRLRAAALQAFQGVIERSPVDTGAFRGNNRLTVGSRDDGYNLEATGIYNQQQAQARIAATREPFTVIFVQNSLPYASELEHGSSTQAPRGVYAVTFNSLKEAADRGL